jgi:oligoendopeptidase F
MARDALQRLDDIEAALEELRVAEGEDAFDLYYRHADVDLATHEKKLRDALLEPDVAETCTAVLEGDFGAAVRRRATIVSDWVTEMRAETDEIIDLKEEIQKIVINTKPELDGEEIPRHEKTKVIFKDDDRERRRRAFESEGELRRKLGEKGRLLYKLRNEAARALGYADYPSLALARENLTPAELEDIFAKYETETRGAYEELLAEGVARFDLDGVEPWDLNYVAYRLSAADDRYFPKEAALPSLSEVVKGYGRDLDAMDIPIHHDADIPYGGLCFAIRTPDDIRILLNLKDGMGDFSTLYHEFGHGVHRKFTTCESFALKHGDAGFFAEAMADTWALLISRPAWLRAYTTMDEEEISRLVAAAEMAFACRTRRFMAQQSFEMDAYRDADGDLDEALSRHAERFLGYRYDDAGRWSEVYFPLLYPMYSKNYMLARVIQRAVHRHLEKLYGELLGEPKVFDFLVEKFYADGALDDWKAKLASVGAEL